jgi:hypothetical protein
MRTMFSEICLLNYVFFINNASFIWNGKEWGKMEGEREREGADKEREA